MSKEQEVQSVECKECGVTHPITAIYVIDRETYLKEVMVIEEGEGKAEQYGECPECGTLNPIA